LVGNGARVALAQASKPATEIVLVGTVHSPTPKFQEETLVKILNRVKPDLILLELDPSFFDASNALADKYQRISLESSAATTYVKSARVALRPYDIEGRNKFYQENDYFGREMKLNQEISRLHAAGQLAPEAKLLFESLLSLSAVRDACGADAPEVFNSSACDTAIEKKQFYAFKGIQQIIELTPALKEMTSFWTLADDFWTRRNAAMVSNILKYARELRPARIVVLAGFEHRYFLRKELAAQVAKEGFVLRSYQEF